VFERKRRRRGGCFELELGRAAGMARVAELRARERERPERSQEEEEQQQQEGREERVEEEAGQRAVGEAEAAGAEAEACDEAEEEAGCKRRRQRVASQQQQPGARSRRRRRTEGPERPTLGAPAAASKPGEKASVCAACLKPIRERYLLAALDKYWHEDCLKCACCDCRLGEVGSSLFTHSDKLLCRRDFLRIFGQHGLCAACNKSIPPYELVMRANQNAYHMDCFACQHCRYRFCVGDRFHLADAHRILCLLCHSDGQQAAAAATAAAASSTLASAAQAPAAPPQAASSAACAT